MAVGAAGLGEVSSCPISPSSMPPRLEHRDRPGDRDAAQPPVRWVPPASRRSTTNSSRRRRHSVRWAAATMPGRSISRQGPSISMAPAGTQAERERQPCAHSAGRCVIADHPAAPQRPGQALPPGTRIGRHSCSSLVWAARTRITTVPPQPRPPGQPLHPPRSGDGLVRCPGWVHATHSDAVYVRWRVAKAVVQSVAMACWAWSRVICPEHSDWCSLFSTASLGLFGPLPGV